MSSLQKNKKKILILCPYPKDQAAGQRLKYEQYISDWEKNNYEVHLSSFMCLELWNVLYKKGFIFQKIKYTIFGYLKILKILPKLKNYDYIYVFMWVTPLGSSFFERMVRKRSKRLIYDIEDNILEREQKNNSLFHRYFYKYLRSTAKIQYLIKNADHVIASSPYLSSYYCKRLNKFNSSSFISSSLNMNYYQINNKENTNTDKNEITIGWTGTFSSKIYLKSIEGVLKKLAKKINFKLLIIGNFEYEISGVNAEVIKWTAENEIDDLNRIDIGIYPLLDDKWVLGKSGLKALQYMALGIPTVATDVGTSSDIINNMHDGILVNNEEEWVDALKILISDSNLRNKLGKNARLKIEQNYSTNIIKYEYLKVFKSLSKINVGLIFSSGELGGAEKSLTKMAKSDDEINYSVYLYAKNGPFIDWLKNLNVSINRLGKSMNILSIYKTMYKIRYNNLDIVYVCGLKISLVLRILLSLRGDKRIKFINAVRHSPFSLSSYDRIYILLEKITKSFVTHYITNSLSARNILTNNIGISASKISNIYNGLDYFPLSKQLIPIEKKNDLIITVANINHRKGHISYLAVIKRLIKDFKSVRFMFIGRDDLNGLVQNEIKKLQLQDYIEIVGFKKDVDYYYKNAKICVLPSTWGEGSPTSIIESMSWGTPVISYDVGGCAEIIKNDQDGFIVPRNNSEILYQSIKKLLTNNQLLEKMSKNGLINSKKYLLENCTNQHKNVFNQLIN